MNSLNYNLFKNLKKDNQLKYFKKVDKHIQKLVGHKLITFTVIDKSIKFCERIYSNNEKIYPLMGQKPMPKNIWAKKVIKNKNHFLCKNKKEIKKIYFDHDIIFSLKCGSIVNLLILFNNKPIGTINILHNENHYITKDIKKIEDVTIFMIPFFLNHQHKMKKH